jgi:multicomponent Na+:H+ antiporter subunit B
MKAKIFASIAVIITGAILLYAVTDFPSFGDPRSPANAGVAEGSPSASRYYIENTYRDTKVPNLVTAILADYRGYDTLFETVVIFTAGMAIFAILRVLRNEDAPSAPDPESTNRTIDGDHHRIIVGITCRLAVPLVQIFALYVVAHGHHSPGGGFQGGVMLGASFILIALSGSLHDALARFSEASYIRLASLGILIYAGVAFLPLVFGRNFVDYGALRGLLGTEGEEMARSHGIFGVELGVAFTVMAVMFAIFANLSTRGRLKGGL